MASRRPEGDSQYARPQTARVILLHSTKATSPNNTQSSSGRHTHNHHCTRHHQKPIKTSLFSPHQATPQMATAASFTSTNFARFAPTTKRSSNRRATGGAASGRSLRVYAHGTGGPGGGAHLNPDDVIAPSASPVGVTGAVLDAPRAAAAGADGAVDEEDERKNVYVETYGCQMNVNDSEVMLSVLKDSGYDATDDMHEADVILVNTCAIREKAEAKIWQRLAYFKSLRNRKKKTEKPVVGVLGCLAERLKTQLLEALRGGDIRRHCPGS